jgi:multiple sugar transport system permease protein
MLYTFFARIPSDLIEAARIDGASEIEILRRIVLPLSLPGLIAVAVYAFMWAWNDLFYALTIMTSNELRTVGPGLLLEFFGEMQQDWGGAMAASLLASMPVVLVFALLQRFFVEGLTAGAVKA